MSDAVTFAVPAATSKLKTSTTQEVNNLTDFLKLEFQKFTRYKILYNVIQEEIITNNACEDPLKTKIANKLMQKSCLQCSYSGNVAQGNLLDIDMKTEELSYAEINQLKNLVNIKLKMKFKNICDEFHEVTGKHINDVIASVKETSLFELSSEDKILLEYKNQLTSMQNLYLENSLVHLQLLEEMMKLRLHSVPEVTKQKIYETQVRSEINILRSQIAEQKVRVDIFTETDKSLEAFKILIGDIKEQQKAYKKEIEELQDMKERYKLVSCKQFDDILKSFIQYKSTINKKRLLLNCLKS